jgi:hypothetical protein
MPAVRSRLQQITSHGFEYSAFRSLSTQKKLSFSMPKHRPFPFLCPIDVLFTKANYQETTPPYSQTHDLPVPKGNPMNHR